MDYTFKEISDQMTWDSFLDTFPTTETGIPKVTFIQYWNWGEVQRNLGNDVYHLGIYESENLIGVALGIVINAKRGKYLYIRNGPILDWENKSLVNETINHLKVWAKQKRLWFVRISPLVEKSSIGEKVIKDFKFPIFQMNDVEALDTWIMNLNEAEEEIFAKIDKKDRYLIRKAQKEEPDGFGVKTLITTDSNYIKYFYEIYKDTFTRHKWTPYSFEDIKNEFETFAKNNQASLILMEYQGKYIAGGIFIHAGFQSFYHAGASLSESNKIPASYLMLWEAIKESKRRGKTFFNFWGIAPENRPKHPWSGLTAFKKKFPGFEQRWMKARDIPVSPLYWLTNLYERYDKHKKGY
jgi:peptidoglycan pentaglycine glycine transferase (the first glycine)